MAVPISPEIMSRLVAMDEASRANARILIATAMKQIEADVEDADLMEVIQVTASFVACMGYMVGLLTGFDEEKAVPILDQMCEDLKVYAKDVYPMVRKNAAGGDDPEPVA